MVQCHTRFSSLSGFYSHNLFLFPQITEAHLCNRKRHQVGWPRSLVREKLSILSNRLPYKNCTIEKYHCKIQCCHYVQNYTFYTDILYAVFTSSLILNLSLQAMSLEVSECYVIMTYLFVTQQQILLKLPAQLSLEVHNTLWLLCHEIS